MWFLFIFTQRGLENCIIFFVFVLCLLQFNIANKLSTKVLYQRRGNNVVLNCGWNHSENSTLILWKKLSEESKLSTANHTYDLRLDNVQLSDSGVYVCEVYNFNVLLFESKIDVIVQDIPNVPKNLFLVANSENTLTASWEFGDDNNSSISIHNLYLLSGKHIVKQINVSAPLHNVTFHSLLPYTCYNVLARAMNDIGWSDVTESTYAVTLPGRPAVVPPILLQNVSDTTVVLVANYSGLVFKPEVKNLDRTNCPGMENDLLPLLGGPLNGIRINIATAKPYQLLSTAVYPVAPGKNQTFTLTDLEPYTSYNLSISFDNGRFRGPLVSLLLKTEQGVPDEPHISNVFSTPDSLAFRWENGPKPGGVISGYKLELYRCGEDIQAEPKPSLRLRRRTIDASMRQFNFSALDPSTCYAVRVASGTRVGFGNFSKLFHATTDDPPPSPPKLMSVTFLDNKAIQLNWTCSATCSTFIGKLHYVIYWCFSSSSINQNCTPTQTHQVFCNCDTTQQFQSTELPYSVLEHPESRHVSFSVRSVAVRDRCFDSHRCRQESIESNPVTLDLRDSGTHLQLHFTMMSRFHLDNTTIGVIVGIVSLIFISVTLTACFSSRLRCVICVCHLSLRERRHNMELPAKYRRTVPFRLNKTIHKPILFEQLKEYVAAAHANDDASFQTEFEAIERAVPTDWATSVARLPENMTKNRYSNVLAYDHTRVILKDATLKTDYINANYVDGYHRRAAYIAAQGPVPSTFDDFWLMVWEQDCNVIVMISNFIERGRRKCDKYWPSSGQQVYGNVSVRVLSENVRAFFTLRVFAIRHVKCKRSMKDRIVHHYQYTDWRDFDVPPSALPVLKFVMTSITHWSMENGPMVVHCSAGVGRTGTYICIESLIRQLKVEQAVSVRGFLEHIRQQRMKLVQTEQQYAFIHDALREHVLYSCHVIRPSCLSDYLEHLRELDSSGRSNLEIQYDLCMDFGETFRPRTLGSFGRRCSTTTYGSSDLSELSWSTLHGYRSLCEFIVVRHPPAGSEREFWKMIWEENCSAIVCLSRSDRSPFWPGEACEVRDIGWLHVSFARHQTFSSTLTRYEFLLTSDREDYALACALWRFTGWQSLDLDDHAQRTLTCELLELIYHIQDDDSPEEDECRSSGGPIVVVDDTGGSSAGIFCALRILMDQLSQEELLDVYFVFKLLCLRRPKMFQSHHDLEFIYLLLHHYLTQMPQLSTLPYSFGQSQTRCNDVVNPHSLTAMLSSPTKWCATHTPQINPRPARISSMSIGRYSGRWRSNMPDLLIGGSARFDRHSSFKSLTGGESEASPFIQSIRSIQELSNSALSIQEHDATTAVAAADIYSLSLPSTLPV